MATPVTCDLVSRYSSPDHWSSTQEILKELTKIANQSITASLDEKETLFEQFLNTIYSGYFDELTGGLISNKDSNNLYYKPTSINLSLCRLLLASDQVFYHGEFRLVANKILLNLASSITSASNKQLEYESYFDIEELYCSFNSKTLTSILEKSELALFKALSNNKLISNQLIYTKCCSLKDASTKINMHYKEAQILEYSINEKLNKYTNTLSKSKIFSKIELDDTFQINSEFIEVISESWSSNKNIIQRNLAESIFTTLEAELNRNDKAGQFYHGDLLNLICAGISLLTIAFNQRLLNRIFDLIKKSNSINTNENNPLDSREKTNYQKDFIITFLKSLPSQFDIPEELLKFTVDKLHSNSSFNLVFIDKHSIDCDQQVTFLNSKFNAFQKIFIYESI